SIASIICPFPSSGPPPLRAREHAGGGGARSSACRRVGASRSAKSKAAKGGGGHHHYDFTAGFTTSPSFATNAPLTISSFQSMASAPVFLSTSSDTKLNRLRA